MTAPSPLSRFLQALALIVAAVALVVRAATPPAVVPDTAPDTTFSAARAMVHVRSIAQRPHPTGSDDNARVRGYIVTQLGALGLEATIHDTVVTGTRYERSGRVANIVARVPGRSGSRRAVLLASHYDSHRASPGAGDAGSAVGALLETVRALRAAPPLEHDLILLITDGEETGLLGAAAFVRHHPWAQDVDVMLNFEARGTHGRSFMFETAAGNLDVARVLRRVPDVSATSLMVLVYRILPNDTDLSELMALARPAMNFAFIDGVQHYHTPRDDVAHLDPRSVQHHGLQALTLARAFGNGPLPRPSTDDAVFFDVPFLGLVLYPQKLALPLAIVTMVAAIGALVHARRRQRISASDLLIGAAGAAGAAVAAAVGAIMLGRAIDALHIAAGWGGSPQWLGIYWGALVTVALAIAAATWAMLRRIAGAAGLQAGALLLWTCLAVTTTVIAPGASYLLVWPVLATCAGMVARDAILSGPAAAALRLLATGAVFVMIVPLVYLLGVALGSALPGAAAAGLLTGLGLCLIGDHIESLTTRRWAVAAAAAVVTMILLAVGAAQSAVNAGSEAPPPARSAAMPRSREPGSRRHAGVPPRRLQPPPLPAARHAASGGGWAPSA